MKQNERSKNRGSINLGVAGLGLAGAMMIRAAAVHPRISLCAGADPLERPRQAFERAFGGRTYESFEGLCGDPEIEAIYIATPHQFHADQVILALASGKHVVVEKPLALTLHDCDRIIEASDASDSKLIVGHTHAFDPNVRAVRRLVERGELGRLGMVMTFNYTDFLYRPRRPEELDTQRGGGIVFNQVSHQIEIVRLIAGGLARSVRACAGALDASRPTEGHSAVLVDFENGACASLTYSGYDFFDSDALHSWVAEGGGVKPPDTHGARRRELMMAPFAEPDRQKDMGFGGQALPVEQPFLPHFGLLIVTGELGDVSLSPEGLIKYDSSGKHHIIVPRGLGRPGHGDALDELWAVVREGGQTPFTSRWGKATLEVALAVLQSAEEKREIGLKHQVAC